MLITKAVWRSETPREAQSGSSKLVPLVLIAFCIFVPVFNASTKPACHYDLGLYYLQEIRWIETFPIVRGVGNLILNLGFNQSAFLVTSLLDTLLPERIGLWLVGGLLPWLGLTLSTYAAVRLLAVRKVGRSPLEIAYAISLPAWIYTLLGNNISSGSPDVTSSCLLIHLFLTFAAFIMTADHLERARLFGDLWILSAICVCLKLNTLGMVVGICFMAVLFLILERDSCRVGTILPLGGAGRWPLACWGSGSIEEFFSAVIRSFHPASRPHRLPGRFRRGQSTSAARIPSTGRAFLGGTGRLRSKVYPGSVRGFGE